MTIKVLGDTDKQRGGEPEYVFDTEYLKKMMQFHRQVNSQETAIGVYISSTAINKLSMVVIQYFINLFKNKEVKSPLNAPIVLLFDPELNDNKLDVKVSYQVQPGYSRAGLISLINFCIGPLPVLGLLRRVPFLQRDAIQIQP